MRFNDFLAFLFTLIAVLIVISGFVLSMGEFFAEKPVGIDCDDYSLLLFPDESKVDTVIGEGKLVKLWTVNAGNFGDNYKVSSVAPDWVVVKPSSFSLRSDESKRIYLYMSPGLGTEGKYNVEVTVKSDCVTETQTIQVSVIKD